LLRGIASLLGRVAFLGRIASLLRRVVAALRGRLLSVSHLRAGLVVVALGRRRAVLRSAVGRLGLLGAAVLGGLVLLAGHGGGRESGWGVRCGLGD
jgi:hypothetical protein